MLEKTKHTPGQWRADDMKVICDGTIIAQVYPPSMAVSVGVMDDVFANANLIAAAPEMKALIAFFIASLASSGMETPPEMLAWALVQIAKGESNESLLEATRAVIAKLEGGAK